MIDILVVWRSGRSTISFDSLPTFTALRRAIGEDVVGHDSFVMHGTTQRGTAVPIKDQPSFIRALGPRNDLTIEIREQIEPPHTSEPVERSVSLASSRPSGTRQRSSRTASPSLREGNAAARPVYPGATTSDYIQSPVVVSGPHCETMIPDAGGEFRCAAYVPPLKQIWTGERDTGSIVVRDATSGTVRRTIAPWSRGLANAQSGCLCILYVPPLSGGHGIGNVWAGFNNKSIKVFDAQTSVEVRSLVEHSGAVTALEYSGGYVFSASLDFTVLQWNSDTLAMTRLLSRHRNGVRALCCGPVHRLISGGDDRSLMVWHAQTGELLAEQPAAHSCGIHAVTYHRQYLWSGDESGLLKAWTLTPSQGFDGLGSYKSIILTLVAQIPGHKGDITSIRGLGDRVFSFGADQQMLMYDADRVVCLGEVANPHNSSVSAVASLEIVQLLRFWTGGSDRKWCYWTLKIPIGPPSDDSAQPLLPALASSSDSSMAGPSSVHVGPGVEALLGRIEVDQATDRTLITLDETKCRAELALVELRRRTAQSCVEKDEHLQVTSQLALESHEKLGVLLISMVEQDRQMLRDQVIRANDAVSTMDRIMQRRAMVHEQQRRESEKTVSTLHEQLRVAREEIAVSQDDTDNLKAQLNDKESELSTMRSSIAALNETIRISRDELQLSERRIRVAEEHAADARSETLAARRQFESQAQMADREWQKRLDEVSHKLHEAQERADIAEREEHRRKTELLLEKENSESLLRRLQQSAASLKESEEQRAEAIERERSLRQRQMENTAAEVASLKQRLEGQSSETADAMASLTSELRDLRISYRQLQDERDSLARRLGTQRSESITERELFQSQIGELRGAWRAEVEALDVTLHERAAAIAKLEAALVEKDNAVALLKSQLNATNVTAESMEGERLREKQRFDQRLAEAERHLASANDTVSALRVEAAMAAEELRKERAHRVDVEARLTAAETSYETLRRRSVDECEAIRDATQREVQALEAALKQATESAEREKLQLSQKLEAALGNSSALRQELARCDAVKSAAEEDRANALRQNEVHTETTARLKEEVLALHRAAEARRAEFESARTALRQEASRLRDDLARRAAAEAQLADELRVAEAKHTSLVADLEMERHTCTELRSELRRTTDRAAAEKSTADEREKASAALIDRLRSELVALRAASDAADAEKQSLLRTKRDLEATVSALRGDAERRTELHQSQLQEKDVAIEALQSQQREQERTIASQQSINHELDVKIAALQRQHAADTEERRRAHQAELEEARDVAARAEASWRRAEQTNAARREEWERTRSTEEKRRRDIEAALEEARGVENNLRAELQTARSAAVAERERANSDIKLLRDAKDDVTAALLVARRKLEAMEEEKRGVEHRLTDTLEQSKAAASREMEAVTAAHKQEVFLLTRDIDEARAELKLVMTLQAEVQEELRSAKNALMERERAHQQLERDSERRIAVLQTELDAVRRQLIGAQAEAAELQFRLQHDLEVERESAARDRNENVERNTALRQLEWQLATSRAEHEREARRANDVQNELNRAQERLVADREFYGRRVQELVDRVAQLESELRSVRDQYDARALQIMHLETACRESTEKVAVLTEASDRWRERAQQAQVSREQDLAVTAAERAHREARLNSEAADARDSLEAMKGELQAAKQRGDDLERENTQLRREMHDIQHMSEEIRQKSTGLAAERDEESRLLRYTITNLRAELSAVVDERDRALDAATHHERQCTELHAVVAKLEQRIADESAKSKHLSETYMQCADGIEEECSQLRQHVVELKERNESLSQQLEHAARTEQRSFGSFMLHFGAVLDATLDYSQKRVDFLQAFADHVAQWWPAEHARAEQLHASMSAEVRRLTSDLVALRAERDALHAQSTEQRGLLAETQTELNVLHIRFQDEVRAHDGTRSKLHALESSTVGADDYVALRNQCMTVAAERDALRTRCELLSHDPVVGTAQRSSSTRLHLSVPRRGGAELTADEAFVLETRAQIVAHIRELLEGMSEACRLMEPVSRLAPQLPDLESLICVYEWLSSARTRAELIKRSLFTELERVAMVPRHVPASLSPFRKLT